MVWSRYRDNGYVIWRRLVLQRDSSTCQHCGAKGTVAHHVKSFKDYPELRLELENGLTLCKKCHYDTHRKPIEIKDIECACGCGTMIKNYDQYGRPRKFVNLHSRNGAKGSDKSKELFRQKMKGRVLSQENREKISKGLRNSKGAIGRTKGSKNKNPLSADAVKSRIEKRMNEFTLIDPNGVKMVIKGIARFCKENKWGVASLKKLISNEWQEHKGWKRA